MKTKPVEILEIFLKNKDDNIKESIFILENIKLHPKGLAFSILFPKKRIWPPKNALGNTFYMDILLFGFVFEYNTDSIGIHGLFQKKFVFLLESPL